MVPMLERRDTARAAPTAALPILPCVETWESPNGWLPCGDITREYKRSIVCPNCVQTHCEQDVIGCKTDIALRVFLRGQVVD